MMSDLLLLLPVVLAALVLLALRGGRRRKPTVRTRPGWRPRPEEGPPANAIVVDGSNVLHWGGEPSGKVLNHVLHTIEAAGLAPIVIFDANVGYVLADHFMNETALSRLTGVPAKHIHVVHKGTVADEVILGFAEHHGLRVVSNDQYRDWRVQFPFIAQKGRALRGSYRDGAVVWRGTL